MCPAALRARKNLLHFSTMTISVEMPVYCFDVVISQLQRKQAPPVPPSIPNQCL